MARIRTIKPKYWDDSKLKNISRDARLLFIGMWTFADDLGVLLADPVWIKSKIFPYDDLSPGELEKWINEIKKQALIVPGTFHEENFYLIKNFTKHQVVNKPNNCDVHIPKDCVSIIFVEETTFTGTITEQSRNDTGTIREQSREEGKGKERKGEEVGETTLSVFDAEKEILGNQIQFERICMAARAGPESAKEALRKFHLYLIEKDKYPQTRKQIFAGFERWLRNEKPDTSSNGGKKKMVI